MKQNDLQLVLKFKKDKIIVNKVTVRRLSRKGCSCCKRRKIKCDETWPTCFNCSNKSLDCSWPNGKISPNKKDTYMNGSQSREGVEKLESKVNTDKRSINLPAVHPSNLAVSSITSLHQKVPNVDAETSTLGSSLTLKKSFYLNENLRSCESFCCDAFQNGFLLNIGQSYYRVKCSIEAVLLRHLGKNKVLTQIYLACGFSFLLFNGRFSREAMNSYLNSVRSFLEEIKNQSLNNIEIWTIEAVQIYQFFCLKDFFIGKVQMHAINHLNASYNLLNAKVQSLEASIYSDNTISSVHGAITLFLHMSPFMRPIVENFMINYCFIMFFADYEYLDRILPNPFESSHFFDLSISYMQTQEDEWFDEEVFFITNRAFKLFAQCIYILRHNVVSDNSNTKFYSDLLLICQGYLESLEFKVKLTNSDENMKNILKGCMVLRSCLIILKKRIDSKLSSSYFYDIINEIICDIGNPLNDDLILPVGVIYLSALTSTSSTQRRFFRRQLVNLIHRMKSCTMLSLLNYLDHVWKLYGVGEVFENLFNGILLNENSFWL